MDTRQLREQSRKQVQSLGYLFNPHLPVLDQIQTTRTIDDVVNRVLCLNACAACSYGFSRQQALEWLRKECLLEHMTERETAFVSGSVAENRAAFQWRVEAIWALTWATGHHSQLDFGQHCSDNLVNILPNLNASESSEAFRRAGKLRSIEEISAVLDVAYCLHWAVREEKLQGQGQHGVTNTVQGQVIEERRHALEWLVCEESWEEVPMDT